MGILDKIFNRNNTYYTNREGKLIPARINVKYRRNYLGFNLPTRNPALATDTIVTLSPSVRGATTQRITLSGPDSHTEYLDNAAEWIPSDHNDYWEPRGREAINNLDKKPTQQVGIKQQGGTMNAEQQELQYALIGYVVATKKQPKDKNEINQWTQALVQLKQQDPEKFNQLVQLGQQAQALKAEKGAKLNYIKSLKGQCPDGEELVYFKKGGMIDCGCQKKEKGGEVEQPKKKLNAIDEFKKKKKNKLDESKHIKRFTRDVIDKMNYELGDPYALNRVHNNRYRDLAEDNKVTGLHSLIRELELRWMANPKLGGKPEGPTLWDEISRPSDPTVNVDNIVNKLLKIK